MGLRNPEELLQQCDVHHIPLTATSAAPRMRVSGPPHLQPARIGRRIVRVWFTHGNPEEPSHEEAGATKANRNRTGRPSEHVGTMMLMKGAGENDGKTAIAMRSTSARARRRRTCGTPKQMRMMRSMKSGVHADIDQAVPPSGTIRSEAGEMKKQADK